MLSSIHNAVRNPDLLNTGYFSEVSGGFLGRFIVVGTKLSSSRAWKMEDWEKDVFLNCCFKVSDLNLLLYIFSNQV